MNNYIPLNKAVKPVCIYDGYAPLINKTLGVDAMTYGFNGAPSEYATCHGAPEMFIKIEQDGLYYFGVEADDEGSISIAGEQLCKKIGTPPNGKLNLATESRYLKTGYYKVALSYGNNAYKPVSGNAIAFNVTMDTKPIQPGTYTGDSIMNRTFSTSPKIKLWTIEKESSITCEPSKKAEVILEKPAPIINEGSGENKAILAVPQIFITACKDEEFNEWRLRVHQVTTSSKVILHTGGYRDAIRKPPLTEAEAIDAVNTMNRYQTNGRGSWHTQEATMAHEEHHLRQFDDALKFYWENLRIQDSLEMKHVSCDDFPDMDKAIAELQKHIPDLIGLYVDAVKNYTNVLPDQPNDRPYCAGQKALNDATRQIIAQAEANGWSNVPREVTEPGVIEPPCFLPPVNKGESRSRTMTEQPESLKLSIADTSQFVEGKITICFRNEGDQPVRLPDEINDDTADFFFMTVLRTDRGNIRVLNAEMGKMTFQRALNYRELAPSQEYHVTIPVCLDRVDLEAWKECSCELETRYYNQQGNACFLGTLRATTQLTL